jgi:hypothetical protein
MKVEIAEQKEIGKEMLPQIVNRIFSICKADENFPIKKELKTIDDLIKSLEIKAERQDSIVIQSLEIKKNLEARLSDVEEKNFELQSRLLETLGSEL